MGQVELVGQSKSHGVTVRSFIYYCILILLFYRLLISNPTSCHNIDAYVEKDWKSKQVQLTSLFGNKHLEGNDPK